MAWYKRAAVKQCWDLTSVVFCFQAGSVSQALQLQATHASISMRCESKQGMHPKQGHVAYPIEAVLVFPRVGKADILERQHRRWQLVTVWKLEVEGALMLHWGSQTSIFHLIKNLLFALGLLHQVRICSCSRNKPFEKCSGAQVTL